MCEQLKILSKANATRYIAQCEHGTIHLVWDNLSLRLPPEDFISIAEQVWTGTDSLLGPDQKTGFGLRMRGIELKVYPQTLTVLRSLMALAMLQMTKPADIHAMTTGPNPMAREFPAVSSKFSIN